MGHHKYTCVMAGHRCVKAQSCIWGLSMCSSGHTANTAFCSYPQVLFIQSSMALKENRRIQAPWKAGTGNIGVTWETKGPQILGLVLGKDVSIH